MLIREAANINFVVCGLTQHRLEPMIYRTRCEHASYYTTDAVENYKNTSYQYEYEVYCGPMVKWSLN